jgi:soluble lytic murein transglycosylase
MINTSARAGNDLVSFSQLYPMPHRSAVTRIADEQGVSPAWVYGIIRQESRFMPSASSSVGARGLMQIMPATERWLVRKLAMPSQAESGLSPLDWNMTLGSAYLGMLLDKFDGSYVLASAAYNAGAGRSRAWRRALDAPMEAAVFIETIPFYETRGYVKNVLSNTQTYATIAHRAQGRFKDFIGSVVPAEAETDSDMP